MAAVHLGIYEFDGDPEQLLPAYDAMMAAMPVSTAFHLCAIRLGGIVVYDTCPTREAFERFSTGEEFHGALRAFGLPEPRISSQPVHAARSG
jgi:hypothetical protein